jgi:hypothetical protein
VVVDPGQDLGVAARAAVGAGEPVVGEVGLPGLVRLVGFEADVGGLGALVGLGDDQPSPREVAGDGGDRDSALMVVSQVPGDGVGSGVESLLGELFAEPDDQLDHLVGDRGGGGLRATGAGLERGLALGFVAGLEPVDPGAVHAVAGGHLGRALVLDEQGSENETRLRHDRASRSSPVSPIT